MSNIVTATFENGVLVPDDPLELPAQSRVRLTVEPLEEAADEDVLTWDDLEQLWDTASVDSRGIRPSRDQLQ